MAERLSVIVCFKAPANVVSGTPDRSLSVLSIQVNAFQRKRVALFSVFTLATGEKFNGDTYTFVVIYHCSLQHGFPCGTDSERGIAIYAVGQANGFVDCFTRFAQKFTKPCWWARSAVIVSPVKPFHSNICGTRLVIVLCHRPWGQGIA
ncbi:MAG: hypothetical protein Ct9H90mP5_03250 [Acidimicrobiaceae bacterium]|nr:MAG: hypothetical protein Ct9H90mP5_03250 [Acidimicrobiaceae bacterium]